MDPTGELPSRENLNQEGVLLPKEMAMALGRGLNQLLSQPLEQIRPYIDNLKKNPQVDQTYVQAMEKAISRILAIPDNLEHSKEVKIVTLPGGLDFAFSEERTTEGQPSVQSEIIIDDITTPTLSQLTSVMRHKFNNSFGPLIGCPGLIEEESTNDPTVKQQAAEIASISQFMLSDLNPIQTEVHQLKISTDAIGSTTIAPSQLSLAGQKT